METRTYDRPDIPIKNCDANSTTNDSMHAVAYLKFNPGVAQQSVHSNTAPLFTLAFFVTGCDISFPVYCFATNFPMLINLHRSHIHIAGLEASRKTTFWFRIEIINIEQFLATGPQVEGIVVIMCCDDAIECK